jgi:hypothetical protein
MTHNKQLPQEVTAPAARPTTITNRTKVMTRKQAEPYGKYLEHINAFDLAKLPTSTLICMMHFLTGCNEATDDLSLSVSTVLQDRGVIDGIPYVAKNARIDDDTRLVLLHAFGTGSREKEFYDTVLRLDKVCAAPEQDADDIAFDNV